MDVPRKSISRLLQGPPRHERDLTRCRYDNGKGGDSYGTPKRSRSMPGSAVKSGLHPKSGSR